jgi:hypothetical protein
LVEKSLAYFVLGTRYLKKNKAKIIKFLGVKIKKYFTQTKKHYCKEMNMKLSYFPWLKSH